MNLARLRLAFGASLCWRDERAPRRRLRPRACRGWTHGRHLIPGTISSLYVSSRVGFRFPRSSHIMKRIITLIAVAAGLVLVGPAAASANCGAIMTTPGYHDSYTSSIDVQVSRYLGMTCNRALRIGAAAYLHPGLRPIYGPQFGGGGLAVRSTLVVCPAGSMNAGATSPARHAGMDTDASEST